jgi:hypothetical protein
MERLHMAITRYSELSDAGATHRQRGAVWIAIVLGCSAFWGAGLWLVLNHL